jgi:diguanylate cyclase (GGDEF)-like protein
MSHSPPPSSRNPRALARVGAWLVAASLALILVPAPAAGSEPAAPPELWTLERALRAEPERHLPAIARLAATAPRGSDEHLGALALLGLAEVTLGHGPQAEAAAAQLAALAPAQGPALGRALAGLVRGQWQLAHGDHAPAVRLLEQAQADAPREMLPHWRLALSRALALALENRGRLDDALALDQQALALADERGPAWWRSDVRSSMAWRLHLAQQPARALALGREALALAEASADDLQLATALTTYAILLDGDAATARSGQALAEQRRAMQRGLHHARRAGARRDESLLLANLSDWYLRRGEYLQAQATAGQALALARELRDKVGESVALTNSGLAAIALGQVEAGRERVLESLAMEQRAGSLPSQSAIQHELGLYLEKAGRHAEAWVAHREHRRLAEESFRQAQQQAVLELEAAHEAERQRRDLEAAGHERQLAEARLLGRSLQALWVMLALATLLAFVAVVALLVRRVRRSNAELRSSNAELREAGARDPLTGLANRRHFQQAMEQQGAQARVRGEPDTLRGGLLLLDVDHFKAINDRHGHAAGDAVLMEVARRLDTTLRPGDLRVRWGGEEFLVLVTGLPDAPEAALARLEDVAIRLLQAIGAEPVRTGPDPATAVELPVTVSIGVVAVPLAPQGLALSWEAAVDLADKAMYLAKAHGRNRACVLRSLHADAADAASLEAAWREGRVELNVHEGPSDIGARAAGPSLHAAAPAAGTPGRRADSALHGGAPVALLVLAGASVGLAPAPARAYHEAPIAVAAVAGSAATAASAPRLPAQGMSPGHVRAWADEWVRRGLDEPAAALHALAARRTTATAEPAEVRRTLWLAAGLVAATARDTPALAAADQGLAALAATGDAAAAADRALLAAAHADAQDDMAALAERLPAALAQLAAVCDSPHAPGCDYRQRWRAWSMEIKLLLRQGQPASALDVALRAADWARRAGDAPRQALALAVAGDAQAGARNTAAAWSHFRQAEKVARDDGSAWLLARLRLFEMRLRSLDGELEAGVAAGLAGLAYARAAASPRLEAMLLTNLSDARAKLGRPRQALADATAGLLLARRLHDLRVERVLLGNQALARIALGEHDAAEATLDELLAAYDRGGAPGDKVQVLAEFADAFAAAGQFRRANALHHRERSLAAELMARNRDAALAVLRQRYDTEAQQRRLNALTRDNALMQAQIANRERLQRAALWGTALLALAGLLVALLYRRVRQANRRLALNHRTLREQSRRDPLTGLANRRALHEHAAPADADGGLDGTLLLLDIDHFKQINDRLGHAAGDRVLVEVGRRLGAAVRGPDLVARWGGEEFLVHAPGVHGEAAQALAGRLLNAVAAVPVELPDGVRGTVTVSIGWASFPLPPAGLRLPLERATPLVDMALYRAKNEGRNRAVGVVAAASPAAACGEGFDAAVAQGELKLLRQQGPTPATGILGAAGKEVQSPPSQSPSAGNPAAGSGQSVACTSDPKTAAAATPRDA